MNTTTESTPRHTPLYDNHLACGARMVDFAGWSMPINYGSQIEEHHAVRQKAGMFDVSHMRSLDLKGAGATAFLRTLLANDVAKLQSEGKALYSCMLNEDGHVLDDLIVYRLSDTQYRIVVNAGTAEGDIAWMRQVINTTQADVTLTSRDDLAMLAIQGPDAIALVCQTVEALPTPEELPGVFHGKQFGDYFVGHTGYTGEDGVEIALPAAQAPALWDALQQAGVRPCGLGARDTLRLEAGMNLYGQDMDTQTSPLDAGLSWTVDFKDEARDFYGKKPLQQNGRQKAFLGLILEDKGVLRPHLKVRNALGEGETTSGSFSPTLNASIALARLPADTKAGDTVDVEIRGKWLKARTVKLPFVRNGKVLV